MISMITIIVSYLVAIVASAILVASFLCKKAIVAHARPVASSDEVVVAADDVDYSAIPSIRSFAPIVIPTRLFNGIERSTPGSKTQKIRIGHNTPLSVFDIPVYAVHMNASAAKQYQASWRPNLSSIAELPQLPENGFMAVGEAPSAPTKNLLPGPKNLYWELCREADLADEKKTLFGFEEPVSSNVSKYVPSAPLKRKKGDVTKKDRFGFASVHHFWTCATDDGEYSAPAEEESVVVVADEVDDLTSPFPDAELDLEDEDDNDMEDENRSDNNEISIVDETTPIVLRRSPRLAARRNETQDVASSSELLGLVFLNGRRRSLRLMHRTC